MDERFGSRWTGAKMIQHIIRATKDEVSEFEFQSNLDLTVAAGDHVPENLDATNWVNGPSLFKILSAADFLGSLALEARNETPPSQPSNAWQKYFDGLAKAGSSLGPAEVHALLRKVYGLFVEQKRNLTALRSRNSHVRAVLRPFDQVFVNAVAPTLEHKKLLMVAELGSRLVDEYISTPNDLLDWGNRVWNLFEFVGIHEKQATAKVQGMISKMSRHTYRSEWFAWLESNAEQALQARSDGYLRTLLAHWPDHVETFGATASFSSPKRKWNYKIAVKPSSGGPDLASGSWSSAQAAKTEIGTFASTLGLLAKLSPDNEFLVNISLETEDASNSSNFSVHCKKDQLPELYELAQSFLTQQVPGGTDITK